LATADFQRYFFLLCLPFSLLGTARGQFGGGFLACAHQRFERGLFFFQTGFAGADIERLISGNRRMLR
jgi:hypothetical protein